MKRSKHSLSNYRLTSLNQGQLYPTMAMEVLPGDSIRMQIGALVRVSPLVAPVMHPIEVCLHCWYVPSRILWTNFEDFITNKNTALTYPVFTYTPSTDTESRKMAQSLGVGVSQAAPAPVSLNALPFRAYNEIWNEYYRDQDLHTKLTENKGDGPDTGTTLYNIQNVSWEKDYFTTCRAQPQQWAGDEVVPIGPSGVNLPIIGLGKQGGSVGVNAPNIHETNKSGTVTYPSAKATYDTTAGAGAWIKTSDTLVAGTYKPDVWADTSGVSLGSMSINAWRAAMAKQKFREHRNRYGSRYRDLLAFLGVRSSDARLQRPEYLGGGKTTLSISEVLSTADAGNADVGTMAGHGIASVRTRPYRRFIEEHGYIICLLFARPRTVYMSHVPRMYLRRKYEDVWQKELEMMGEQLVTNFEIYGDSASPATAFGYIPRYDEYRHMESSVAGEFRNTLDYWHMARKFAAQPVLNGSFVSSDPTTRIYASAVTDQLYAMVSHRISARRLVSKRARS